MSHGYPAGYLNSRGDSWSEAGSEMEMNRYPSQHSMASYGPSSYSYVSGSRKSLYSTYTSYAPSQISYMLPIVTKQPNPEKKPADHWGFAFCSLFINPLFGIFAILLSEQSKVYFSRLDYVKASKYGSYAKGVAAAGIVSMFVLLILILALVLNEYFKYRY
ncbi:uncharacterized protein LOC124278621 [Haliotis rubra]|uniref:uncharacterized protein LOC124278621 n=1 Tax=Haliotis rubra TaxID=36100 RepID=UPI001EE6071C|nr:uncharacterized protein LOC124278621 [Haliotis rubra]